MENIIISANYEKISHMYNVLTKIISLGGNQRSQNYFLKFVKSHYRILNVGCGPVQFSAELSRKCNNVISLDISDKMIEIDRRDVVNNGNSNNISFICLDIMNYSPKEQFDIVFANFFLNTFSLADCQKVLRHLASSVKTEGLLCIADEIKGDHCITRIMQLTLRPLFTWLHHIMVDHPLHPIYDYRSYVISLGFSLVESNWTFVIFKVLKSLENTRDNNYCYVKVKP